MLTKSPKQARGTAQRPEWFGYYAGYSTSFVDEALTYLNLDQDARVLDPWNGSGTTTDVVERRGFHGVGYDLNPAVVIVARARLLRSDVRPSHRSLGKVIVRDSARLAAADFLDGEPLSAWFSPKAAAALRGIERAIQRDLISPTEYVRIAAKGSLSDISPLAAYYYVALFRTVRRLLAGFKTSNPTWTRFPESPRHRLRPSTQVIHAAFDEEVERMFMGIEEAPAVTSSAQVDLGDSTSIKLGRHEVDAVVSSPPYCTRIDYAVSMRPELAVLGMTALEFRALRLSMLGCTILGAASTSTAVPDDWGASCAQLLDGIRRHPSHGSASYYYPTHVNYFASLFASYAEIARVLRPGGRAILVVQDSYYKELHTDLQAVTSQMCQGLGLTLELRRDYSSRNTKAAVNTRRLKYRNTADATESVLVFSRS
ncbi:MAG: site-specific DNA-methyltransferase [Sandaracinaceae bacterium]|nr:site-specific DNA-methyltransferase [Sandaracinaceae bacterium]